jgi:hypothetical protein
MDRYSAAMVKQAQASLSGAALDRKLASINQMKEMYKNPVMVVLFTYLEVLPVGILISLFAALILKRKTARAPTPAMA